MLRNVVAGISAHQALADVAHQESISSQGESFFPNQAAESLSKSSLFQQFEDPLLDLNAKPYDISEPLYTCPKAGYFLVGDECVSETRVESRLDCPPGYQFTGASCQSIQPVQWRCPSGGSLNNRKCQLVDIVDADLQCPIGSQLGADGICTVLDAVNFIEVCPEGTIRAPNGCLAVEYHEPVLVCPPDTVADGRKCRRELVSYKYKKGRRLTEEDAAVDSSENLDSASPDNSDLNLELEGSSYYAPDGLAPLGDPTDYGQIYFEEPQYSFVADPRFADYATLPPVTQNERWLPAEPMIKLKNSKKQKYDPLPDSAWDKATVPSAKYKVKVPKKPVVPQQIVKVVTQAAEKICPVGTRYGPTCINETIIPPVKECPVPLLEGVCARRIATAPIATCQYGGRLNCNARRCKCEILHEYLAVPACPLLGFELAAEDQCLSEIPARRLCPLGFFLDPSDEQFCIRRDTEPALTLFSVTYVCTDCADHSMPVVPTKKTGGRGKYLVAQESKSDRKSRKAEKERGAEKDAEKDAAEP